jgi:hypothetical protein
MTNQGPEHRQADRAGVAGATATAAPNVGPFDAEHPPPLDFAAWAAMAARLLERDAGERLEILADREVDPELWDRCETYWAEQLAREIGAGEMGRATDYASRCANELAMRRRAPAAPNVDETAWLVAPVVVPALPFSAAGAASPAPRPIAGPADSRLDLAGETQTMGPQLPPGAPLPFVPTLALEEYAALCARLAVTPADALSIASTYGIADAQQLRATHMAWIRRFDQEPELRLSFQRLEQHYRSQRRNTSGKATGRQRGG